MKKAKSGTVVLYATIFKERVSTNIYTCIVVYVHRYIKA